ncbi:MAG: hypothetical protein Q7T05_02665, partial [Dehalococcoidia bacterium]|nr:hypothetical protein [Dehalococcoidia bacterium]
AIIRAYDAGTHTATIEPIGSPYTRTGSVTVAANILAADVVAGRYALVYHPSNDNPAEYVIVAVYVQ